MALNPRFAGHRIGKAGGHTIELYVDYVCPFSKKMFDKLYQVSAQCTRLLTTYRTFFRPLKKTILP